VAESRRFVVESLADVRVDVQDAVSLMVSELATNAVMHAASQFELVIDRRAALVRVEVNDVGDGSPVLKSPSTSEPHGRGLRIVDELSDEWGASADAAGPGKSVWFVVRLEEAQERPDRRHGNSDLTPSPSVPPSLPSEASSTRADRRRELPDPGGRGPSPQAREQGCPLRGSSGRVGRGRRCRRRRPQAGVTPPWRVVRPSG
jgi:hypothetical protein